MILRREKLWVNTQVRFKAMVDRLNYNVVHRIGKPAPVKFAKLQGDWEERCEEGRHTRLVLAHASALEGVLDNHNNIIEILTHITRKIDVIY